MIFRLGPHFIRVEDRLINTDHITEIVGDDTSCVINIGNNEEVFTRLSLDECEKKLRPIYVMTQDADFPMESLEMLDKWIVKL